MAIRFQVVAHYGCSRIVEYWLSAMQANNFSQNHITLKADAQLYLRLASEASSLWLYLTCTR